MSTSAITKTQPLAVVIQQKVNPKTEKTRTVPLTKLLARDIDPRLLVKSVTLNNYRFKMVSLSDQKFEILVMSHTVKKPKLDTKGEPIRQGKKILQNEAVETIAQVYAFAKDQNTGDFVCDDPRFDSGFANKVYTKLIGNLASLPCLLLADQGIIEKSRLGKVLSATMSTQYECTMEQSQQLAVAFYQFSQLNREYRALTPKEVLTHLNFVSDDIGLLESKSTALEISDTEF